MKKLKPILGFECSIDKQKLVSVEVNCDYPQQKTNCLSFYKKLEELKITESNITFPIRLKTYVITINPTDKFTIMNYFKINGIKKIVEENKSNLVGKTTFIKPEIQYPPKAKYPNLHIHFYQVSEDDGMEVVDMEDLFECCFIHYNTNQFTKKRISDLEKYVNTSEIRQMPFLPMELVKFDKEGNIQDFESHLLALKSVELPF
jgi:hypothetical protein